MKKSNKPSLTLLFVIILALCFSQIIFSEVPSDQMLYIGAPDFFGAIDAGGYSDWIYWGETLPTHDFGYHELLSGE